MAEGAAAAERIRDLVAPLVSAESARLYDVEHNGGVLRVLVDADGGIGLDAITRLARAIGRELDTHDPIPGRYTLEVSSPGLERRLRTPDHFRGAVGAQVKVKTIPDFDGPRRVAGVLVGADEDGVSIREAGTGDGADGADGVIIDLPDTVPADAGTGGGADGGAAGAGVGGASRWLGYDEISWARTVFEWGPAPRPGRAAGAGSRRSPARGAPAAPAGRSPSQRSPHQREAAT